MVIDVKRAFLHAPITEEVDVDLLDEAKTEGDADCIGLLRKAMYGTREAPLCWQRILSSYLAVLGFKPGVGNPCLFSSMRRGS